MNNKPHAVNKKRKKGVALVFALFTAALLMSMSVVVVAVAHRHGKDGAVSSYSEAAIHAANWGVDATLNYMGEGIHWQNFSAGNTYLSSFNLKETSKAGNDALGNFCKVRVTNVANSKDALAKYGLSLYKTAGSCTEYGAEDNWKFGDTRLIEFCSDSGNGSPYYLEYGDGSVASVETVLTELRFPRTAQPSRYQIVSFARVYRQEPNAKITGSLDSSAQGTLLASRKVECVVREQTALDFMHFVQNAKAWDVQGVDPSKNSAAQDIVRIPDGYQENGRLRVDGGGAVPGTAGSVTFHSDTNSPEWTFNGDVTMNGSKDSIKFEGKKNSGDLNKIFGNGLNDGMDSLGMPTSVDANGNDAYVSYAKKQAQTQYSSGKSVCNFDISGDRSSAYNASHGGGGVPDVMKNNTVQAVDAEGNPTSSADTRPSFAKIVVKLDGDRVQITKVNPAKPSVTQTLYNGKADGINNGIVTVTGGNVEVCSALKSNGDPVPFTGSLTIVTEENAGRRDETSNSIYSETARDYYTENPHLNPPYTEKELGLSSSTTKLVWPTPSSAVEREANVFMTSDIAYGETGSTPPSLGIVSRNFVLLNDKKGDNKLSLDCVLMSLDHCVQFDWDNLAQNSNHDKLMQEGVDRTFQLNGAIVSSFLDVEGDYSKRGYYTQGFLHDENLRFQLPPAFPRWDRTTGPGGTAWNWLILNYVDQGALNRFN